MKLLNRQATNQNPGRWVFFADRLDQSDDPIDRSVRTNVFDTLDRTYTESDKVAQSNRTEVTRNYAEQAVGEMLTDEDHIFNLDPVLRPPESISKVLGVTTLPRLDKSPDSAEGFFWSKMIPWKAYSFWLDSRRSFWNYSEKVMPHMQTMLENSPQFYTRNDSVLMNQTALPTVRALKKASHSAANTSLMAINFWDQVGNTVISGFESEHRQYDANVKPQFGSEQKLKRGFRIALFNQRGRMNWLTNQQKSQIAQAKKEIKNNIPALRKAREDHLQPIQAKLRNYRLGAHLKLQQSGQNKIEDFAAEILLNPEAFINRPQRRYRGIDWRAEFCGKPIDLLEALQLEYGEKVISRASQAPKLEQDQDATMQNIDERMVIAKRNFAGASLKDIQKKLSEHKIDPAPVAMRTMTNEAGEEIQVPRRRTEREVVRHIHRALRQVHQNIDLERDVYRQDPSRLTAEEKVALLIKYLNRNPNQLARMEEVNPNLGGQGENVVSLHAESASRVLARYVIEQEELRQEARSIGSIDEGPTDENQLLVTQTAQDLIQDARNLFNTTIPNARAALRSEDGTEMETTDQALKDFVTNFDNLFRMIGYNFDGQHPANALYPGLPKQQRQMLKSIADLKIFRDELMSNQMDFNEIQDDGTTNTVTVNGLIELLDRERKQYKQKVINKLPPNPERYEQDIAIFYAALENLRARVNAEGLDEAAAIRRAREGGLAMAGGFNFRAEIQTPGDTLEDVLQPIFNRIQGWDDAIRDQQGFSFRMPANPGNYFENVFNKVDAPLAGTVTNLRRRIPANNVPAIPDLDAGMEKIWSGRMTKRAESEFSQKYAANMKQQWALLKSMNVGHEISKLQFGDLTHLDGIFDLTSGVTHREPIHNLRLYRKEGNRLLFESSGRDGVVIAITEPKDLSQNFSFDEMENDDFLGHANCLIFKKSRLDQGEDGLFRVPQTNYDQAGIMLNVGAAQAKPQTRPARNARRAKKKLFGYENIAA